MEIRCPECGRVFVSGHSLTQHRNAKHPPSVQCIRCDRRFRTEAARDQHAEAVHGGLENDDSYYDYGEEDEDEENDEEDEEDEEDVVRRWPEPPPIGGPGRWIPRDEFVGRKSFGYFECTNGKCTKSWWSAHAQPQYKQACKACEAWKLPDLLWENAPVERAEYDERDETDSEPDQVKPHDRERCEACKLGRCTA